HPHRSLLGSRNGRAAALTEPRSWGRYKWAMIDGGADQSGRRGATGSGQSANKMGGSRGGGLALTGWRRDVRGSARRQPTPGSDGEVHSAPGKRKHRRRPSKKKRRWKPYFKLTWEEKKELDERESVRAAKTRAEMFAKGFTVAPYNTTQFLMDEHDREEPDLNPGFCPHAVARGAGKEEESGSDGMGGSGSEFLQRDFCETYERYHAETLQNMSKQELIREYLELEKCLSRLEDENNRLRRRLEATDPRPGLGSGLALGLEPELQEEEEEEEKEREREVQREVERLRAENRRLEEENELSHRGRGGEGEGEILEVGE
uniref:HEXIM P-TEFb complex subunit 1 n=1 Tax=Callorhinchus milii TaxID=7868 RepID=A0A4W3I208_CALMI